MPVDEIDQRIITTSPLPSDSDAPVSLRPQLLDDFIGQEKNKKQLSIFIQAAKQRKEPIEHTLLYGPPGLGKTTLAHILAKEMNVNIRITAGPAIEKSGDLAAILTNLSAGDILFIDEIHRLNRIIEEILYPAMEDYALDIIIGKGPSARTLRLDLPKFTLIGATTKVSSLSAPLRDRFGATIHFQFYTQDEMEKIVRRSAKIMDIELEPDAAKEISSRSRRTPRIANRILRRIRDFAQVNGDGIIRLNTAEEALDMLEIDASGLDATDRSILSIIIEKYKGGPVGLNTLAAATGEEQETIEDVYEPYLIQTGFLERTPRGRMATMKSYQHLGLTFQPL